MFDETFSKLPGFIQFCFGLGTMIAIAFGGHKVMNQRKNEQQHAPEDAGVDATERVERVLHERFDRMERLVGDVRKDHENGFHRLERGMADIAADVVIIRARREKP